MSRLELEGLRYLDRGPIDLDIAEGECVSVSGPSGSGKTLLLRAIADLDPHEGDVRLDGTNARAMEAPEWRRRVGLLVAESQWWAPRVGAHFSPPPGGESLSSLGFGPDVMGWDVTRLSTGEKQRLALLRLLSRSPSALLLDEPTSGLDASHQRSVESLVAGYRSEHGAPVLWVSHDPAQEKRVAGRHYVLRGGVLEASSPGSNGSSP